MIASALSAILGFGREIVTAHYYGTRSDLDAFLNASTVPLVLFGVFNGSLIGALVPTFSEYVSQGREEEARRLGSTILNLLFVIMSVLAALGWLLAPYLVGIVAHGFPAHKQQLEIEMVRWLMPSIVFTTLSGVCGALLNAHHRFVASSLNTVATNIVTIAFVIGLQHRFGIFAIVFGSLCGLAAQLLVQLPSLARFRLYRPIVDLRHPGLAKALALFIPVTLGAGAWQINLAFDRYFASTLSVGSTAALSYATRVAFLPIVIVASAVSTVIFPLIAGHFATSNNVGIRRSVSLALRMVSFIVIPCSAGLFVLAYPIVQTLFERGAFHADSTAFCARLIPFACLPLIAISYNMVLSRACYACKRMRPAVISSFVVVGLNIVLSATLLPYLGARGLLLANGIAMLVGTVFLFTLLWRTAGGLEWKQLVNSLGRIAVAALLMGAIIGWINSLGFVPAATLASRATYLGGLLAVAGITYLAVSRALGLEELAIVIATMKKRFRRFGPTVDPSESTSA